MRGELPSHEQTTCSGNSRWSSVCQLARIEWNNRGQPETPARRVVFFARVVFRVARGNETRRSQGICGLFGSCPLRSKTLVFPGFFAFLAKRFGSAVRRILSQPSPSCLPSAMFHWSSYRLPSGSSRRKHNSQLPGLRTLVFPRKTCGFVVEVQDSNHRWDVFKCGDS
jgi:hypothetical protein